MEYTLENAYLKITVNDHGAELQSITEKSDGTDYLWHGDPTYWKYRSPILFPIVGKLIDGKYRVEGKTYALPAHGLGRVSDFTFEKQTASEISFVLTSTPESLKIYPYKFLLRVSYKLQDKKIIVGWSVENLNTKEMYFSIGAHPAFMCPIDPQDAWEDCYLEFNRQEELASLELTEEVYLKRTKTAALKNTKQLPLTRDTFKKGALVYAHLNSDTISIRSHKNDKVLSVTAKDFPFWGIWAPDKEGTPFVCIEPWHGHADYFDATGVFEEKEDNVHVEAGKTFTTQYEISIG